MITDKINSMLYSLDIPYAYHHFEVEDAVAPPFVVYTLPESSNFCADNRVYSRWQELDIELYTDQKNEALEQKIESMLDGHNMYWEKTESYIESENMYEVLYETEVNNE